MKKKHEFQLVLTGNPNCGKSTLFNKITGAKQSIGNFPGITVECHKGYVHFFGCKFNWIDLPGLYSLTVCSDEEKAAADFLKNEPVDMIVNVVDASNLERNLYLTLLLKEMNRPMVVVLNMIDVAKQRGIEIDLEILSRELGVPVFETIGSRGFGLEKLQKYLVEFFQIQKTSETFAQNELEDEDVSDLKIVLNPKTGEEQEKNNRDFFCGKKRKNVENFCLNCRYCTSGKLCAAGFKAVSSPKIDLKQLPQTESDIQRFRVIERICIHCVQSRIPLERPWSDRIDTVLTSQYWGIPIFLLLMYLVFQLTFTVGQYPMDWIESGFSFLSEELENHWGPGCSFFWKSLVIDGMIGGVGGVLVFLPNILFLFFAVSFLEDSGYLARAALLGDRWMYKIGLQGRSIVPFLIGFGCTVPALTAARMLSHRRERLTTMFVLPLFSCGARFPIYSLLIPAFFPLAWRGPVLWFIYLLGILIAAAVAKLMSLSFPKEEVLPFVIELPPYHVPTFRTVGIQTIERGWQYLKKAGTVILGFSVLLWFLTSYPGLSDRQKAEFQQDRNEILARLSAWENQEKQNEFQTDFLSNENINESVKDQNNSLEKTEVLSTNMDILSKSDLMSRLKQIDNAEKQQALTDSFAGRLGRSMEPVLRPMGFDWKIGTALIGSIAAKEVFVSQLSIIYSLGDEETDSSETKEIEETKENSKIKKNVPFDKTRKNIENLSQNSSSFSDILRQNYTPLTGFCIMLFSLIATPCIATLTMMSKESGSWKWGAAQWLFLTLFAWILTTLTYQLGRFFIN